MRDSGPPPTSPVPMNSLRRMLAVLKLIQPDRPTVDIAQICLQLGYAPATAYRYVRELADVGLLVRLPGGYALGPRIIELDLLIRETDPLLHRSQDLVRQLAAQTGLNVLLSELYEDTVISIHQEFGLDAEVLNFGRGRPMPLFRSATSRVILAHLTPRRLRRVDPGKTGLAAPIFDDKQRVLGSITLVGSSARYAAFDEPGLQALVRQAGQEITRRMAQVPAATASG